MPVTNVEAVKFCNEKIRPMADKLAQAFYMAKRVHDEWYANASLGSMLSVGAGVVVDGAETDGRHIITADDALLLMNRVDELIADLSANNNAKLNTVLKPAVNVE